MAVKNIIVCADGTGNRGGYSPDSNVYKMYRAIDKNFSGRVPILKLECIRLNLNHYSLNEYGASVVLIDV